jgi:hypothetical protein
MKYNLEQIKNMNEQQWQDFRVESWEAKKQNAASPAPDWYLKDKSGYVSFLRTQKEKNIATGKPFNLDIDAIENYTNDEWNSFRKASWEKKNKSYAAEEVPNWFMKDKDSYVAFLEKHNVK